MIYFLGLKGVNFVISVNMWEYHKMIYVWFFGVWLLSVGVNGRGELYERIGKSFMQIVFWQLNYQLIQKHQYNKSLIHLH